MLLTSLLPRKLVTSRFRVFWLALLVLSPVAYVAGIYLYVTINPNAQVRLALDRSQAFAKAAAYLGANGVNVAGWQRYCTLEPEDDLQRYLQIGNTPEIKAAREQARQFISPVTLKVLFHKTDNSQIAEVYLGPHGQPLGFRRTIWQTDKQPDVPPAEALALAEAYLRNRPEAAFARLSGAPKVREIADKGDLTRRYTWAWQVPELAELKPQTTISVYGKQVIGAFIETSLDQAYARNTLQTDRTLRLSSIVVFSLALTLAVIFGLYRFVKRARQKELSYARIFFITCFLATVLNLVVILSDVALYNTAMLPVTAPSWVIYITSGLIWILGGLFIGLAYGGGEGDLREAYPGKLTSIDALILGKLLSRNVGRAALWGFVLGGWLWLAFQLVGLLWARQAGMGESLLPFMIYFAEWPVLLLLTSWQTDVVLVTVIGLLLPLPFVQYHLRPEGRAMKWLNRLKQYLPPQFGAWVMDESHTGIWVIALVATWAWIISQVPVQSFHPWTGLWLIAALKAALLLVVFLNFDLLTAAVALALPIYIKFTLTAWIQPAPAIHQAGVLATLIATGILLVLFYCAIKGRWYRDEDVRPVYARFLAERLSLQAEVSAARVAQERLLPQRLPISPNFTVAASCVPAHEVGGDFYDFFEVGPHQIAMLVAEGGGRGLGSALSIAYAKGFLMSKVGGQSRGDDSPTEVMRALQERLSQMLTHDDAIGLAYLVLDTSDGVLRYARTGKFPQILLGRAKDAGQAAAVEHAAEYEIKFSTRNPDHPPISIIEGRAEVETGDHLIVYTGGLVEVWQNSKQTPENEFGRLLAQADQSHQLQSALVESVNRCFKLVRKQELSDDLTAVVVRVEQVGVPVEIELAERQ